MQRMICISAEQYNQMIESYDKAMEELQEFKEQLQAAQVAALGTLWIPLCRLTKKP